MDASALLRSQGWLGTGHALDPTGRGIKKPLLISHKQDQLGLGKRKAAHTADDQWWMRAFDESLKNIGTGKESTLSQVREKGINRGGLYGFFVRGEGLKGTVGEGSVSVSGSSTPVEGNGVDMSVEGGGEKKKDKKRKREESKSSKSKKKSVDPIASKLAKLTPTEKAAYEARAKSKGQTLEQYVSRRVEKKDAKKKAKKSSKSATPDTA